VPESSRRQPGPSDLDLALRIEIGFLSRVGASLIARLQSTAKGGSRLLQALQCIPRVIKHSSTCTNDTVLTIFSR
jgi:hypothetical protein